MNEKQPFMTVDYNSWNNVSISNSSSIKHKFKPVYKRFPYAKLAKEFQSNLVSYTPEQQVEQMDQAVEEHITYTNKILSQLSSYDDQEVTITASSSSSNTAPAKPWATEEVKSFWEKFQINASEYRAVFEPVAKKPKRTIRKIV